MIPLCDREIRCDAAGDGAYGAPRGRRSHRGIDLECCRDDEIPSPVAGKVTKLGYPYGDDATWRYVQITDADDRDHRLFYVSPVVRRGQYVDKGEVVGLAQSIKQRYPGQGMTDHVHYEVKDASEYLNPSEWLVSGAVVGALFPGSRHPHGDGA